MAWANSDIAPLKLSSDRETVFLFPAGVHLMATLGYVRIQDRLSVFSVAVLSTWNINKAGVTSCENGLLSRRQSACYNLPKNVFWPFFLDIKKDYQRGYQSVVKYDTAILT